jgi:hypothetical protein
MAAARERLDAATENAREEAKHQLLMAAMADGPIDHLRSQVDEARWLSRKPRGSKFLNDQEVYRRRQRRDQGVIARAGQNVDLVGLAIALVVVGVVMYVGLNVMSTTEQSTELDNNSEFNNASQDLTGGIADAYSLSGILFLVLILTGVVGLLLGLRARR